MCEELKRRAGGWETLALCARLKKYAKLITIRGLADIFVKMLAETLGRRRRYYEIH